MSSIQAYKAHKQEGTLQGAQTRAALDRHIIEMSRSQHISGFTPAIGGAFSASRYGQVHLPNGEKEHQFESNSIKPKRDTRKRIGRCLQG